MKLGTDICAEVTWLSRVPTGGHLWTQYYPLGSVKCGVLLDQLSNYLLFRDCASWSQLFSWLVWHFTFVLTGRCSAV